MSIPKIKRAEELEIGDVVEMYYWGWEKTNVAIETIRKSKSGAAVSSVVEFDVREGMKFPADEPLFLLRAQDKLAIRTINYYYRGTFEHSNTRHSNNVCHAGEVFEQFAKDNPDRMKWSD